MSDATISAISGVVVAAIMLGGQWVVGRFSAKAADTTAEVQRDANAVAGFHELVTDLQSARESDRRDIVRLREDHDELKKDHDALKTDHEALKRQSVKDKTLIRFLIEYARKLRNELLTRGIEVPEPPAGVDIDGPLF